MGTRKLERGSLTIEAALVVPLALLFMLTLVFMVQARATTDVLDAWFHQAVLDQNYDLASPLIGNQPSLTTLATKTMQVSSGIQAQMEAAQITDDMLASTYRVKGGSKGLHYQVHLSEGEEQWTLTYTLVFLPGQYEVTQRHVILCRSGWGGDQPGLWEKEAVQGQEVFITQHGLTQSKIYHYKGCIHLLDRSTKQMKGDLVRKKEEALDASYRLCKNCDARRRKNNPPK